MSMRTKVPLEVGTRGTIGSLLKREIEYFRKVEPDRAADDDESASSSGVRSSSWHSFRFLWRRKKRRSSGIRPGMCSIVDVSQTDDLNHISSFGYLNLRADSERFYL